MILALYQDKGVNFVDELNGIFAFVLYDADKNTFFAARDHMGIIPLYMGWDANGTLYFASELKSLEGVCTTIEVFPPGHYYDSAKGELTKYLANFIINPWGLVIYDGRMDTYDKYHPYTPSG